MTETALLKNNNYLTFKKFNFSTLVYTNFIHLATFCQFDN